MRALYNCSFADPWVKVARRLKDDHSVEPVYWIGYADDDSAGLVKQEFPDAIYHDYFDAWKGVFPLDLEARAWASTPDPEDYVRLAEYELQALQLLDRMDFDQRSFSFQERRNFFRRLIRCWTYIVEQFGIEALISPSIPHRSFDFPLYLVCRQKGIKMVSFMCTPFMKSGRILPVTDLYLMPDRIRQLFKQKREMDTVEPLAADIQDSISRIHLNYEAAKPANFKEYNLYHKKRPSVLLTGRKFISELVGRKSPWLGRTGWLLKGVPSYHKTHGKDVESSSSRQPLAVYVAKIYRRIILLKRLDREYRKYSVVPDLTKKYVVLALHYQPEATTIPRSGIFYDQWYVLELMAKYLPRDWMIYVKENPKQFNPIAEGNTGRLIRFYRDALKMPRVAFVPVDMDPFALIDGALAVFSVSGTIGWEGMVRGKPVICFASSWYEFFSPGVMRIINGDDLEKVPSFIERYRFDGQALHRYLKTIEDLTLKAYFRRGLKKQLTISDNDCLDALTSCVASHLMPETP